MLLIFSAGSGCLASAGEILADPTRPPGLAVGRSVLSAKRPLKWRLTATIIGPQRRIAVINERAVQIGQKIDGAMLVAVEPGGVLLLHENRKSRLKLNATTVKRTVIEEP